jgi:hypothetical protein
VSPTTPRRRTHSRLRSKIMALGTTSPRRQSEAETPVAGQAFDFGTVLAASDANEITSCRIQMTLASTRQWAAVTR